MTNLKEIELELYAALDEFRKELCGGSATLAAKKLNISNNKFTIKSDISGFQRKTVQKFLDNGHERLSKAAETWIDLQRGTVPGSKINDFCFLYAGMQQLLITDNRLIKAILASRPSSELELIEASCLLYGFIYGRYLYSQGVCEGWAPVFPLTANGEAHDNWGEFTKTIMELASTNPDALFASLMNLVSFKLVRNQTISDHEALLIQGLCLATGTYYAAHRVVTEAASAPALKRRPLAAIAKALFDLLHVTLPEMRASAQEAADRLKSNNSEDLHHLSQQLFSTQTLVTGNRPLAWLGQSVCIYLNSKGVFMRRLSDVRAGAVCATRIEKPYIPISGIEPDDEDSITWVVDTDIYNVTAIKKPLPPPHQHVRLIVEHKLHKDSITDLIPEEYLERGLDDGVKIM